MKIISKDECRDWLNRNIGNDFTVDEIGVKYVHRVFYLLPSDTGKKTALGRTLVALLNAKSSGLFWITGSGIWPSSENMELFDGYRRSLGENRPINVAPAHVFSESDFRQLECLVDLALYFYWDSVLFEANGAIGIRTSHDEYVSFYARDRDRLSEIERSLLGLGLKQGAPASGVSP